MNNVSVFITMYCECFAPLLAWKKKNLTTLVKVLYLYASVSFFFPLLNLSYGFPYLFALLSDLIGKKIVSFLVQVCNTSGNIYPFISFSYWFIWRRWSSVTNENKMIPKTSLNLTWITYTDLMKCHDGVSSLEFDICGCCWYYCS